MVLNMSSLMFIVTTHLFHVRPYDVQSEELLSISHLVDGGIRTQTLTQDFRVICLKAVSE